MAGHFVVQPLGALEGAFKVSTLAEDGREGILSVMEAATGLAKRRCLMDGPAGTMPLLLSAVRCWQGVGPALQVAIASPVLLLQRRFPVTEHVDVKAVGVVQQAGGVAFFVFLAVLPDDFLGLAVDHDHAVVEVVHDQDVACVG